MNAPAIHRVLPHLPSAVAWVLALAIGVQAALIARDLIPQPQSTPAPPMAESTRPQRAPAGNAQSMHLQAILNAHLFGEATADGQTAASAMDAPQTQLSLVLAGTIAVEDPQKGIGLIGEAANNAKVYSVGENVPGGVKLNAVYADRVILDRGGQLEALYLPRRMAAGGPPRGAAAPPPQPTQGAMVANRVRQAINNDPGSIAEIMRPQPVFVDGKLKGFRVYPGSNRDQFARLGLQPGDLISEINGTPLNDPARGMEIFRSMGSASEVSVSLERGGRKEQLVLDMATLANEAAALPEEVPEPEPRDRDLAEENQGRPQ